MANLPRLSDLEDERLKSIQDKQEATTDDEKDNLVAHTYDRNMDAKREDIIKKIDELERKLAKHTLKEGMLDKIINQTYTELDELSANEFTRRGQKQSALIKQLESLGVLQDTLMKYEDMIQKYHKIIMDIDNNKLNGYVKIRNLKTEEKEITDDLGAVLQNIQQLMQVETGQPNILLSEISKELSDGDY
jgi:hypothetical protein